jgi:hypothetical protein
MNNLLQDLCGRTQIPHDNGIAIQVLSTQRQNSTVDRRYRDGSKASCAWTESSSGMLNCLRLIETFPTSARRVALFELIGEPPLSLVRKD